MPTTANSREVASRPAWVPGVAVVLITSACVAFVAWRQASRPAWNDEAWVVDYASRPTAGRALHDTLAARQPAAPGYQVMLHAVARLDGGRLWEFRLPSAAAALILVLSAGCLVGRCCGHYGVGSGIALLLLVSPLFQRYAGEIKQYLLEAALSLLLLVLLEAWLSTRRQAAGWAWFAVAMLTVLTTFAGWFAIAASVVVLGVAWVHRKHGPAIRQLALMSAGLGIVAPVVYWSFLRPVAAAPLLQDFWSDSFLPHNGTLPRSLWDLGNSYFGQAWYLYPRVMHPALLVPAAGLGWVIWCRRAPATAVAAGLTVVLTLLAGIAHRWPDGVRINLPVVAILHVSILVGGAVVVAGVLDWCAVRRLPGTATDAVRRAPWLALAGVAVALGAAVLVVHVARQADFEVAAVDRLLDRLGAEDQPGQVVFADQAAYVNLSFRRPALAAKVIEIVGLPPGDLEAQAAALRAPDCAALPLVAIGHHNAATAEYWAPFRSTPGGSGLIEPIWSDHLVALYQFTREPSKTRVPPARGY